MSIRLFFLILLSLFQFIFAEEETPEDTESPSSEVQPRRPHIVVYLADDLGWGNVGFHNPYVESPTMNQLVDEGITLERHYAHHICSPTRSSFQSGRLPVHVNARFTPGLELHGVPVNMTLFSAKLQETGYRTHFIGKWDIGMRTPEHLPINRGYDSALHYMSHANRYYSHELRIPCQKLPRAQDLWEDEKPADKSYYNGIYEEEIFLNRSKSIIESHDPNEPLFLFYSARHAHRNYQLPLNYWKLFNSFEDDDLSCCMDTDTGLSHYFLNLSHFVNHSESFDSTPTPTSTFNNQTSSHPLHLFFAKEKQNNFKQKKFKENNHDLQKRKKKRSRRRTRTRIPTTTTIPSIPQCGCQRIMAGLVRYMDDTLSHLVTTLRQKNMWKDTLFLFTSDNGGELANQSAGNNWPLRGGKNTEWEGGIRVPTFLSGGFLPPAVQGTKLYEMMHIADWYTTFVTLAGGDPVDHRAEKSGLPPVDGLNMWPLLSGQTNVSPRSEIPVSKRCLLQGQYKILLGSRIDPGWHSPLSPNSTGRNRIEWHNCNTTCLFDVVNDPFEYDDLSQDKPEIVKQMRTRLKQLNEGFVGNMALVESGIPYNLSASFWDNICDISLQHYHGNFGPYEDITPTFLNSLI